MNRPVLRGEGRSKCPTCGEYFTSTRGFDDHRIGPFGGARRCLTQTEMAALGWRQRDDGFWVTDSRAQDAVRRAPVALQATPSPSAIPEQGGTPHGLK